MTQFDLDGQPVNKGFNYNRNIAKALCALRGVLIGIAADEDLTALELVFLQNWLASQELLKTDGDVFDLEHMLRDILRNGAVSREEREDLMNQIETVLEYRAEPFCETEQINELLGMLAGVTADNIVTTLEAKNIRSWIKRNREISDMWPVNLIAARLDRDLKDDNISEDECDELVELFNAISGQQLWDTGIAYGMTSNYLCDGSTIESLNGKSICFTGKFTCASRAELNRISTAMGADVKRGVSQNLDFLIVGSVASRDWKYTSYGTKIEKAIEINLSEPEHKIAIVDETLWNGVLIEFFNDESE